MRRLRSAIRLLVLLPLALAACVVISRRIDVLPVPAQRGAPRSLTVQSAVKAHLLDGSIVHFPLGVVVAGDTVSPRVPPATRFDATLRTSSAIERVPLDSIVGMETFRQGINGGSSILLTTLATALGAAATAGLAVAIFGSCPTVYADSAGIPVLQAEVFANRIAPLFEARDIDRLRVRPDANGIIRLDVRNEALETHYINHLELLAVRHAAHETVIPDERGRPLALHGLRLATTARDRAGRDLRAMLASADERTMVSDSAEIVRAATGGELDHLDLVVPRPSGDSAAVVLRMRNSLLTTVLLYDFMLGAPGARSLDWLEQDMGRIGPALELARWYEAHFGLRVSVWDGTTWRDVARHHTYGPISWRDVATMVPVPATDSLRIRLTFLTDEWRIDQVRVATSARRVAARAIPLLDLRDGGKLSSAVARTALAAPDEHYLQTSPGQRFAAVFDAGSEPVGEARTFLLGAQGYYTEWVRGSWIASATDSTAFRPSAERLAATLRRWSITRDSLEGRFFTSRVPVQ